MQASEQGIRQNVLSLRYTSVVASHHLSLRETVLLLSYHLRLLNWWVFLLILLGFLVCGGLFWLQLHAGNSVAEGLSLAAQMSRFVLESGAGLIAGVLASSLIMGDSALELLMVTRTGIRRVLIWRSLLAFVILLLCSSGYLVWSLVNDVSYMREQSSLSLLLIWLTPVLVMSMLGLAGSLLAHNPALGMVISTIPLAGALAFYQQLLPIETSHPFLIPYTLWGYDAPDWWTNRFTLLGIALLLAVYNWWWVGNEECLMKGV